MQQQALADICQHMFIPDDPIVEDVRAEGDSNKWIDVPEDEAFACASKDTLACVTIHNLLQLWTLGHRWIFILPYICFIISFTSCFTLVSSSVSLIVSPPRLPLPSFINDDFTYAYHAFYSVS
jgi:hypothetical protein